MPLQVFIDLYIPSFFCLLSMALLGSILSRFGSPGCHPPPMQLWCGARNAGSHTAGNRAYYGLG